MNVLVLNDNQELCEEVAAYVAKALPDAMITRKYSEQNAFDAIERIRFGLAVVDLMLTTENGCEGFRVVEKIRKTQPECVIVMFTRTTSVDHGRQAYKKGVKLFISTGWKYVNSFALLQEQIRILVG